MKTWTNILIVSLMIVGSIFGYDQLFNQQQKQKIAYSQIPSPPLGSEEGKGSLDAGEQITYYKWGAWYTYDSTRVAIQKGLPNREYGDIIMAYDEVLSLSPYPPNIDQFEKLLNYQKPDSLKREVLSIEYSWYRGRIKK